MAESRPQDPDAGSLEQATRREEMLLFRSVLDLLAGATRSQNAIEREAALRLLVKLKRGFCERVVQAGEDRSSR